MSKGIIYAMTTVVPGLIKIGKTGSDNFEARMYHLEHNGYSNVVGLKRRFAIEVEDYDNKELLIDDLFSKSRVPNTELFALDIDLVIQLLSALEGKQVYPDKESKEEAFENATKERQAKIDWDKVPDGEYYLSTRRKGFGAIKATMVVDSGAFIVKKGSICAPVNTIDNWAPEARKAALISNNVLVNDVICNSPSTAGWVVLGKANNGWTVWKDKNGDAIDKYRNSND